MDEICQMQEFGYFKVIAGCAENLLTGEIAEIRHCERIRRPAVFEYRQGKRIFPGSVMKPTFSKTTPFEDCLIWARQWADKCSNRVVIAKKAYIGGFPIDV